MPTLRGRACRVTVGAAIGALRAGLRVENHRVRFRVEKSIKPEPNTCTLQIWNLSAAQRAGIEELEPKTGSTRGIPVLIEAGYEDPGPVQIFLGDLRTCTNTRDGADWITTIESGDGEQAFANARLNVAYGAGTTPDVALRAIVKALGVDAGNVPEVLAKLRLAGVGQLMPKRLTLSGSAAQNLTNFANSAGLEWSIQDGAIQILDRGKARAGFAVRLAADSGLIESPSVDPKGVLHCRCLMQPELRVGSLALVDSLTVKGMYRVERAIWEGDTYDVTWYTEIEAKRY